MSTPHAAIASSSSAVDLEKSGNKSLVNLNKDDGSSTEFRIPSRCNSAEKQQIVDAVWGVQEEGSPK